MTYTINETAEPILPLSEGDVAILIRAGACGSLELHHNIPALEGRRDFHESRGDTAGLVMAIALLELLEHDTEAMMAAVTRAITGTSAQRLFATM